MGFHVLLVALSAGIALSLPYVVSFIGNNFGAYASIIEKQTDYLQNLGGFYTSFCHYYPARWEYPAIAEYDLETHELIYRKTSGREI